MAGGNPEFVLPVRFDLDKTIAQLQRMAAQGKRTSDDVAQGMVKGQQSGQGLNWEIAGLLKAQVAMQVIKQTAGAAAAQWNETANYVHQAAKEFQDLRKTMQEVAKLKGEPNASEFTLQLAEKAHAANISPQDMKDFQAQFLSYAGSQVGEGRKLTDAQSEEFGSRVAELMKGSGVSPAVGAELAGSMLENAEGPQEVNQLMTRFSVIFQTLEKGRVPLVQALPQISRIMGHSVSTKTPRRCSRSSHRRHPAKRELPLSMRSRP